MKKTVKQIISGLVIFGVTLAAGFVITAVSFNLFDSLTANQMKLIFAVDVLSIVAVATGAWYFFDSKKAKARRKRELEKRHFERIKQKETEMTEINKLINFTNFAA
ncbi:MAG: hypothetical protein J1E36_01835 [Eubacterium sp.]|nr:hypothetical protein [Eubacterium sp.]